MINNTKKLHIGLVSLLILRDWSGVERVISQLAGAMIKRGHSVSIIAQKPVGKISAAIPVFKLPETCNVITVDLGSQQTLDLAREDLINADFDVLVNVDAGPDSVVVPWLIANRGIPLVNAEVISPDNLTNVRSTPYEHYGMLALADYTQILVESYRQYYPSALNDRLVFVGNPVPPPKKIDHEKLKEKKKRTLLALGRLEDSQKNFSLLLRSWAILAPEFPDWSLKIVGDGPSLSFYKALADAIPNPRITFTGAVKNTGEHYEQADLFCMPSRHEGFPLVLLEAASWGLPIVGMRSCLAVRDTIVPEMGALAEEETPDSLAKTLRVLMNASVDERYKKGLFAQHELCTKYEEESVFDKWESLFVMAAKNKGKKVLDYPVNEKYSKEELASQIALIERLQNTLDNEKAQRQKMEILYEQIQQKFKALAARKGRR